MQTRHKLPGQILAVLLVTSLASGCSQYKKYKASRIAERAKRYFKAGEYDNAKIEYLNLLRIDHQNATAFQQVGLIWTEQGAPLRAIPFLLTVRELAPQNIPPRLKLGQILLAIGRVDDARKEAQAILQLDPRNHGAVLLLADTSKSDSEIAFADQQIEKNLEKNSGEFHVAKASLALARRDIGAASAELQEAITLDPKSVRAHLGLGYLYLARGNPGRAGPEFKAAADLSTIRSSERIKYAEFQIATGAAGDAKTGLLDITRQAPDYIPAWSVLAQLAVRDKKFDEALSLLQNVLGRDSDNIDGRMLESDILLSKGEFAKVIDTLTRLNTAFPNNPVIKYQLARAHLANKNFPAAIGALEQAVATSPNFSQASLLLGQVDILAGRLQPAAAVLEELLRKHPELGAARATLADVYRGLGRLDDAAKLFRDQIELTPQDAKPYFLLGLILRQQQQKDQARHYFEKSAELAPNDLNPVDQLVEMDLADHRFDAAKTRVKQELERKPEPPRAHFLEAKIYAAQRDWDHAEAALQKALELDPGMSAAYDLLISVYVNAEKLPQAANNLEAALKKDPNNQRALRMAGFVYQKMENYSRARDAYEKLLTLRPLGADLVPVLNDLAYIYSEQFNRLDRAYELAQKAHELGATAGISDTLGWVLYKRGDYQKALALIQDDASKLPGNPEIQFHLGMTRYMMGEANLAQSAFEKAASAPTDFPGKEEAAQRLSLLRQSSSSGKELSVNELEGLLKKQPNDLIVLDRLAEAYEKKGDAEKAAAAYQQVYRLNSKLPNIAIKLAQLYLEPLHKPDQALEFAKKAKDLAPNDRRAAAVLGRAAFQTGNFTWAYGLLQESARQFRDDPTVLHDFALAAYALGKISEARQAMELCSATASAQSQDAKRFLKMIALDQSDSQVIEAEAEVQKVLQMQPDYVPALMAQAAIQLQKKNTQAAKDIYISVLSRYPDFAPAQKRLAEIYLNNPHDIAKAYDLAVKARKVLPEDPELARTLAEINFERSEFSFAVQLFQESATRQPLTAKDLYFLGLAQLQTRQKVQGRATLERSLAAGLSSPFAEEAKKRISEETSPGRQD